MFAVTTVIDPELLAATGRILNQKGIGGLSLTAIADEAGVSRVTLHRRGVTIEDCVVGVLGRVNDDLQTALWPVLTSSQPALSRLRTALLALCGVAEANAGIMSSLFAVAGRPLPENPERTTAGRFAEAFERILRDGNLDGSLLSEDPSADATLLVNIVGWTYIQMRTAHGWDAERVIDQIIPLALAKVAADRPPRQ